MGMLAELRTLGSAIADFDRQADDDFVDPRRLSAAIDRLQGKLCRVVSAARKRGDHLVAGQSACTWVAVQCQMSKTTAADRLCVGEQLGNLSRIAEALSSGQIGYQAAAVICHLSEQVGEKRQYIDQEHWIAYAQKFSLKDLRYLSYEARVRWDCEGFERQSEEDYELRSLDISETTGGMYRLDAWLDPVGGSALKAAIESLSNPLGADDARTAKQRRADALVEMTKHAMDQGRLPRHNGARPHISVNTTSPHHIEFWARGGKSDLPNLLPLCYHHHRLVHEGGWQVIRTGEGVKFIAPERVVLRRARGPGMRWAA